MTHYVSYRRHMTAAGFEGFGLVLQRAGTVTKYLKVYESGAGTNGTVGMKRVVYEVQRYLKVHCFPASRAGALRSTPARAGAVVRGVSHYATKFTPIGAGTYYPLCPHTDGRSTSPRRRQTKRLRGPHPNRRTTAFGIPLPRPAAPRCPTRLRCAARSMRIKGLHETRKKESALPPRAVDIPGRRVMNTAGATHSDVAAEPLHNHSPSR